MEMTEKRINDLEKMGRNQNIVAMVCYVISIVLAITAFITNNDEAGSLCIFCWLLGFVFSVQSYQNYNDRRVAILLATVNKIVDVLAVENAAAPKEETPEDSATLQDEAPEADTKETMIVSPEDFERFQKGEMTKEELLGIKKSVDKVTEAKKKVDKSEN